MSENRGPNRDPTTSKTARTKRLGAPLAAPTVENASRDLGSEATPTERSVVSENTPFSEILIEVASVEPTRHEITNEGTAMNDHPQDGKRDAGSPEDQSKQASHEAKTAALQAQRAADAAAIATADLKRRKAISTHGAAILDAENSRDQSRADKERFKQQLDGASKVSRHLHTISNEANTRAQAAADHYQKLKMTVDQALAEKTAVENEAKLKADEYATAQKEENDLRVKVTDLDTADEQFELAKAAAEVVLANAKSDFANEIAKIKKAAADRDMSSFMS
jgi:hypothetical protein